MKKSDTKTYISSASGLLYTVERDHVFIHYSRNLSERKEVIFGTQNVNELIKRGVFIELTRIDKILYNVTDV